jgi:hypothetical protein
MDCAPRRIRHKRHYGQRIDTTFTPSNILARGQLNPYLQAARRKEVEQWQSGADLNVIANSLGMRRIEMDAERAFAKRGVHDFTIACATAPASA